MKPLAFEDLARLPLVSFYEGAFRRATGVTLKVVPAQGNWQGRQFGCQDNLFCRLMACDPTTSGICLETEERARQNAARKLSTHQLYCHAGLTVVATPVIVGGHHIATLLSGQIFRREPTERDFQMIIARLGNGVTQDWIKKARKAYFETAVLTAERFQAAVQLLEVFAQYLADSAGRLALAGLKVDPPPVASAKEFVQAHVEETISLEQVVEHVHVSRFYFCKLFKKVTGLTLTEYIARARVEKAKALLSDPSRRISEIVFASGFGSIPRFNSVFKRHVGMPPSEYRELLRSKLAINQ
ncbi:MAG TPA: PocR ligand-binding domain-containing protein [Candidatus Limnocylindrales bacterium]|jgi:two-component system response regulator YesN|nr:PocR ligand-binding domain-containing protein [Candidatus Limnocylindrales bacterium]